MSSAKKCKHATISRLCIALELWQTTNNNIPTLKRPTYHRQMRNIKESHGEKCKHQDAHARREILRRSRSPSTQAFGFLRLGSIREDVAAWFTFYCESAPSLNGSSSKLCDCQDCKLYNSNNSDGWRSTCEFVSLFHSLCCLNSRHVVLSALACCASFRSWNRSKLDVVVGYCCCLYYFFVRLKI